MCDGFSDNYLYRVLQSTECSPGGDRSALAGGSATRTLVTGLIFVFSLPILQERSTVENGRRPQRIGLQDPSHSLVDIALFTCNVDISNSSFKAYAIIRLWNLWSV